jgi:hypothetical protein
MIAISPVADRGAQTGLVMGQASGPDWHLYHGDCIEVARGLPTNSLHYSIYSPPFESLYTFSDDPRDLSNNNSADVFWEHYRFLIRELYRATMPGRLTSIHCMELPTSKLRDGFIGVRDFPGEIVRMHQEAGWIYHSRVMIRKDPVSAMQRTKAIGLLHKQLAKDSALSRMCIADYVVHLRKPGENEAPIAGPLATYYGEIPDAEFEQLLRASWDPNGGRSWEDHKSISIWQRYAESIWLDIAQSDVLSHRAARAEQDERHISPLQLTPIRRCVQLWSLPGEAVFSPFAGIGSELYVACEMGRKALGAELKKSYFEQAVANLRSLESRTASLLDGDAGSAA